MALFSRRVLQRLLDENSRILREDQTREHVKRLNTGGERTLQTEWEVAVLNAFSRIAIVKHEEPLPTGATFDLDVTLNLEVPWSFVADIVTVSDVGFRDQNPYDALQQLVIKEARRRGLNGAGLDIQVDGSIEGKDYRKRRMKLALPRSLQEHSMFAEALGVFLDEVAAHRQRSRVLHFAEGAARLIIEFTPGAPFMTGGYPSYTVAYGIKNNPVYRALEDKARDLRNVSAIANKGIVVCDADCDTLRHLHGSSGGFGLREIMREFLDEYKHVDFVLCLIVHTEIHSLVSMSTTPVVRTLLFGSERLSTQLSAPANIALQSVAEQLPRFRRTPQNAIAYVRTEHQLRTRYAAGGWEMTDSGVRISARAVLNLLAGKVTHAAFMEANGFIPARDGVGPPPVNPFKIPAQESRLFIDARIERRPEDDDDWIVFTFGPPDAAVAPFSVAKKPT